jgi:hypothetical protein
MGTKGRARVHIRLTINIQNTDKVLGNNDFSHSVLFQNAANNDQGGRSCDPDGHKAM